jgi:hypothetical protein
VGDKLVTGKMPPPPAPAIAKEDVAAVTNWIERLLKSSGYATDNPGRVVARRLNPRRVQQHDPRLAGCPGSARR